ncbi:hypothetical protein C3941_23760 [Kaistia algarum]|uniref:hypothetical protein n=1 Tax=Kaistia algarum TaxID=2083279 RepID=UPI000CE7DF0A|nr:hypothetical protein [Kaistia algarum]MCX5513408.1 hypothetical protein [Kaistia algarum]PPE77415.1 hypothetical protein C3941_23760 [Kaistia algarum]
MTFTITAGWWLAPLAITIGVWLWAFAKSSNSRGAFDIGPALFMGSALIASLAAWLVWALLT